MEVNIFFYRCKVLKELLWNKGQNLDYIFLFLDKCGYKPIKENLYNNFAAFN